MMRPFPIGSNNWSPKPNRSAPSYNGSGEHPVRLPQVEAAPVSMETANVSKDAGYDIDQLQGMMTTTAKKYAWTKGDFSVTPYGFLWGNMVYETDRTNDGDTTFYVYPPTREDNDDFHVNARGTRLGLDVVGPRLRWFDCAESGGKVEIDFYGNFIVESKPGILVRHAYWEVKNEDYRLLMGQTWDVIGPLNPNTIMYSVYWAAGNIGYRRAQLRGERFLALSDTSLITVQGSLNANVINDYTAANDGVDGDHGGWPVIEGRTAWTLGDRGKDGLPITVGVSGHIGNTVYVFDNTTPLPGEYTRRTWSLNADYRVPVTHRMGVQGEVFTGENLSQFLGGILQGINSDTTEAICSSGGWIEFWYDWTPRWHTNVGYTVDDPFDQDLTAASAKTYNQAYYGNLIYDLTKQFKIGFEVSQWKTLYKAVPDGDSTRFEFMAKYGF